MSVSIHLKDSQKVKTVIIVGINVYSEDSIFCSVNELIFSKWFCCINLDFLCLYKGIKSKSVLMFKSISSRISNIVLD